MDRATDKGAEVCHHAEELLEFSDICGCWESMHSIDLCWVWVDTIGIIQAAKEIYRWGLYLCLLQIEHNSILAGYPHEVLQMGIMFCLSATMNGDVIGDSDTSRALFEELVHLLLEDVL